MPFGAERAGQRRDFRVQAQVHALQADVEEDLFRPRARGRRRGSARLAKTTGRSVNSSSTVAAEKPKARGLSLA